MGINHHLKIISTSCSFTYTLEYSLYSRPLYSITPRLVGVKLWILGVSQIRNNREVWPAATTVCELSLEGDAAVEAEGTIW